MESPRSTHTNHHLRQARIERAWRQQDLAELLGTTVGTIKRWERGSYQPGPYFRAKLCTLFGKSAEELGLASDTPALTHSSQKEIAVWSLPFTRNPFFTGREQLVEQLHVALTRQPTTAAFTQTYALQGLGGIGKTQVAIEYAYQYRRTYHSVLWVQAETQASLTSSYGRLAAALELPEHAEEDQSRMVAAVIRWLNRHEGWLLIFDNVEELALLKPFLPASDQGALLLTTHLQSLGNLAKPIELTPMTSQEGCTFLLARTNRPHRGQKKATLDAQEEAAALALTDQMGGLPLALEQAGAYIDATQCSISDYLQLFQTMQQHLLDMHEPFSDHPLSVKQTFLLSFEQIAQRHQLATALLNICAFLAPDAIPETFFQQVAPWSEPTLETMLINPLVFQDALKALLSYSLIQRSVPTRTISIHRLVQTVLKSQFTEAEQHLWRQRVLAAMEQFFPTDEATQTNYLSMGDQLLPHALAVLELAESDQQNHALRVSLMSHIGSYLCKRARYGEAKPLFTSAIQLAEHTLEENDLLMAGALLGLADLYREQGQYSEATSLCERVLDIRQQKLDPYHPQIAVVLDQLGVLHEEQGHYEQAQGYYQRALDVREQILSQEHPQIATSLYNLGVLYREQHKYELAKPLLLRSVDIWEKTLGPEHHRIAASLTNLGVLSAEQGDYEQAEAYHQRARYNLEQSLGPEHPHVATALNNLGVLHFGQGNYKQAELYHRQALRILQPAWGPEHPRVGTALNNLGAACYELGNYELAESYYQQALHIREQTLSPQHPDIAYTLTNLGEIYYKQRNDELAEKCYQRALQIWKQALSSEHPDIAYAILGLANLFREQGKYEQAGQFYQHALEIRQRHLSPQHPDLAETLHELALFYQLQQHTTEALASYQQALAIRQQVYGRQHPKTQETQRALTQLTEQKIQESKGATSNPTNTRLCACGCGRLINRSENHGKPKRFFSAACRQRVYRHTRQSKRRTR